MAKKPKPFTPTQVNRLAEPGYYISYIDRNNKDKEKDILGDLHEFCYIGTHECKYIRTKTGWGPSYDGIGWNTLSWSAAPTKNGIEESKKSDPKSRVKYVHFDNFNKFNSYLKEHEYGEIISQCETDIKFPIGKEKEGMDI